MGTEAPQNERTRIGPAKGDRQRFAGALVAGLLIALVLALTVGQGGESATAPPSKAPPSKAPLDKASAAEASPDASPVDSSSSSVGRDGLRIGGSTVWRWDLSPTEQAYIFRGDCVVRSGTSRRDGETVSLVVDRQPGRPIRAALLVESSHQSDFHCVLSLPDEPELSAPWYRGRPETVPDQIASLRYALRDWRPGGVSAAPAEGATSSGTAPSGLTDSNVALAQFAQSSPERTYPLPDALPIDTPPASERTLSDGTQRFLLGNRSIDIQARNPSSPSQFDVRPLPESGETAVVVRGGATVTIRDVQAITGEGIMMDLGAITLSANTIVGWFPPIAGLLSGSSSLQQSDGELYLEGDIVFRQGDRVIYADRMYYNIAQEYGMILSAEAITSIPEYEGYVRLKADVIQQVAKGDFIAFGAAVTSSRMGVPRYWLQSEQVQFRDMPTTRIDPLSGQPYEDRQRSLRSEGNTVYVGGFPVLYWPVFSSNLEKTNFYLTGLKVKRDNIFGTQVMADFDIFQLFGVEAPPDGVDWILSTDYFSERGPALGTRLNYSVPGVLGIPGPVIGLLDAWAIQDNGLDTLGQDRKLLQPEEEFRGRVLMRHRHYLPNDYEFIAEIGLLSDRNFLEQYLESEWDQDKDHDTGLRLRKYHLNNLFDLHADVRVNEFYTDTNRLPQLDHYNIGSGLFDGRLNWSAHNRVGYASLEVADPPTNPIEAAKFTTVPGEVEREGLVASSRQELSAPVNLGAVKLVPFVSGEAGFWGEDVTGQELTRLLGQAGVRGSLPAWRLYPTVESSLFNVRGLAHKAELRGEIFYADSDTNLEELPLYDPLDDDAQEQFRRRLIFNTFGGALPAKFDPRLYAFRQGLQRYVTSPSTEVADDMLQGRVGLHQRLQTKRGLPGRERIVDLVRFDVDTILFFNEDQDNFGEAIGPTRYDFRYHVGDRVSLLSDGYFDFFEDGLRSVSAGVMSSRPGLGDVYLGILSLEGPISSTVLRGKLDYRLNEKWIASAGTTFDLGEIGNVGQQVALTRIGESILLQMGLTVDAGRDNVGFQFQVEPRFWPGRLGRLGGSLISPPGIAGLE